MPPPLTTSEAAALTTPPTTRFTVEREIGRGNLSAQKVGGRWLIESGEAERWAKTFKPYQGLRRSPGADRAHKDTPAGSDGS